MFSVKQKREISEKIQTILRETGHPELPKNEIKFHIHVYGAESWSWADIKNNGSVILEGILCQECGVYMGGAVDYPRTCTHCEEEVEIKCRICGNIHKD